jgi:hypothetical protein
LPFKVHQDRQHQIPKQRHRVTNWPTYEAGLRARGSLVVWFSEAAIEAWRAAPRTTRGGQPRYSALAIETVLTLRALFQVTGKAICSQAARTPMSQPWLSASLAF